MTITPPEYNPIDSPFLSSDHPSPTGAFGQIHTATDGRDILVNSPDGWEVDAPWIWYDGPDGGDGTGGPFGNPPPNADLGPTLAGWTLPAVSRCLSLTADKLASMPWKVYRGRDRIEAPSWLIDPQALARDGRRLVVGDPGVRYSGVDFWAQHLRSMILLGEGMTYTPRIRDRRGEPTGPIVAPLYNLNPQHVEISADGRYWVKDPRNRGGEYPGYSEIDARELIVTRYIVRPGRRRGLGVLAAHAADLGFATAARGWGDNLLRRGVPNGYLKSTKPDIDDPTARKLQQAWMKSHGGIRKNIAVLNATTEFHPISIDPQSMEYVEMLRLSAWQIALMFGVPPGKLGVNVGGSLQYQTVEMANTEYVQDTLQPLAAKIESAIDAVLPVGTSMKIEFRELLRGDTGARFEAYRVALEAGFMTIDEVREAEDLPPIERIPAIPDDASSLQLDATPTDDEEIAQ